MSGPARFSITRVIDMTVKQVHTAEPVDDGTPDVPGILIEHNIVRAWKLISEQHLSNDCRY